MRPPPTLSAWQPPQGPGVRLDGGYENGETIPGIDETKPWTNHQATLARELPKSLVVMGGGPTGCEMAQVYARFEVPTTIVQSGERLMPTDHPRNAEAVTDGLHGLELVRTIAAPAVTHLKFARR